MTDHPDIVERLMRLADGYAKHAEEDGLANFRTTDTKVARIFLQDAINAEITRLRAEAEQLRSVMIAAAEEIQAHWPAHCDAEGYGPANLMRRLEEGIPSQYAYTAGDFERLRAEAEALRKALQDVREALRLENDKVRGPICDTIWMPQGAETLFDFLDAAIAATKEQQ